MQHDGRLAAAMLGWIAVLSMTGTAVGREAGSGHGERGDSSQALAMLHQSPTLDDLLANLQAFDGEIQTTAVTAIARDWAGEPRCIQSLLVLWDATDRFDVRHRIAETLAAMGDAGIDPLLQLARAAEQDPSGERELIARTLAELGEPALEALARDIERAGGERALVMRLAAERAGADLRPWAVRLAKAEHPEARMAAQRDLVRGLGIEARSKLAVEGARDGNARVREAAAGVRFPVWLDHERAANPQAHAAYLNNLRLLLDSDDDNVIQAATTALQAMDVGGEDVLHRLRTIAQDLERDEITRAMSLRAMIVLSEDQRAAVAEAEAMFDEQPLVVCIALRRIDVDLFSDELVGKIVGAITIEWQNSRCAQSLIVPAQAARRADGSRMKALGARAAPALVQAVRAEDDALSLEAATMLGKLGAEAKGAEGVMEALAEQITRRDEDVYKRSYMDAMLDIDADDPQVRRVIERLANGADDRREAEALAGGIERLLNRETVEPWVRDVVDRAVEEQRYGVGDAVERVVERVEGEGPPGEARVQELIEQMLDTETRDTAWANLKDPEKKPTPSMRAASEWTEPRATAAMRLRDVEVPTDEIIDAFVQAMQSEILETPKSVIQGWREEDRGSIARSAWRWEHGVARIIAIGFGDVLAKRPDAWPAVIERMKNHPTGLAMIAASAGRYEGRYRPPAIEFAELTEEQRARLVELLAGEISELASDEERAWALGALTDAGPKRDEALMRAVAHGADRVPIVAMWGLGRTRPMTEAVRAAIAGRLDDPRPDMRRAAVLAVKQAEEEAGWLIEALFNHALATPSFEDAARALRMLERAAPEDERLDELRTIVKESMRREPPRGYWFQSEQEQRRIKAFWSPNWIVP